MKSVPFLLLSIIVLFPNFIYSQITSEKELNETYWRYRNRLKTYFITYTGNGASGVPATHIDFYDNPNLNPNEQCGGGYVGYSDGTYHMGIYMTILALEYKLLSEENEDVTSTLNEIYHTIYALNRLDINSDNYFGGTGTIPDGFLLRDDANAFTLEKWVNHYLPNIQADAYRKAKKINGVCVEEGVTQNANAGQDQLSYVLWGLYMLHKYVPNVYLKPIVAFPGYYVKDEIEDITSRIMENILHTTTYTFGANPEIAVTRNMFLVNPTSSVPVNYVNSNGDIEERGGDVLATIYSLAYTAKEITGIDYLERSFLYDEQVVGSAPYKSYDIKIKDLNSTNWDEPNPIHRNQFLAAQMEPTALELTSMMSVNYKHAKMISALFFPHYAIQNHFQNSTGVINLNTLAYSLDMQVYSLLASVIHEENNTGWCGDLTNWRTYLYSVLTETNPHKYETLNDEGSYLYYPGLDFMLLYNVYYAYFKNKTELPSYAGCGCENKDPEVIVDYYDSRNGGFIVNGLWKSPVVNFPGHVSTDYNKILDETLIIDAYNENEDVQKLGLYKALSSGDIYTITSTGKLVLETNVHLCGKIYDYSSDLHVQSGGTLIIGGETNGELGSLSINNASLHLHTGSTVLIKQGCKLIIGEDAYMSIYPNVTFTLEEGAELYIKGRIHLIPSTAFALSGTGTVRFGTKNKAYNPFNIECSGNNTVFDLSHIDVILMDDSYIKPDNRVTFKCSNVQFLMGKNAFLDLGCPNTIFNSTFKKDPKYVNEQYVYKGLYFYGQENPDNATQGSVLINNKFYNAINAITSYNNIGDQKSIEVLGCLFSQCKNALTTVGNGAYVANNQFLNCQTTWNGSDLSGNGLFESNSVTFNEYGLKVIGTGSGNFIAGGNKLYGSGGIYLNQLEATLMCNRIEKCYSIFGEENIHFNLNSTVSPRILPGSTVKGGFNSFNNNANSLSVNSNGTYDLNSGHNWFNFVDNGGWNGPSIVLNAYVRNARPLDLQFSENIWVPVNEIPWIPYPTVTDLLAIRHNGFNHFDLNSQNLGMYVTGLPLNSSGSQTCPIVAWGSTPVQPEVIDPNGPLPGILNKNNNPYSGVLSGIRLNNPTVIIEGGLYSGYNLRDAVNTAVLETYSGTENGNSTINPLGIIHFYDILNATASSQNFDDSKYIFLTAFTFLKQYQMNANALTFQEYKTVTLQQINRLIDSNEVRTENDSIKREDKFQLLLIKTQTEKMFNEYAPALSTLALARTVSIGSEADLVDAIICQTNTEKLYSIDSALTRDAFRDSMSACDLIVNQYWETCNPIIPKMFTSEDSIIYMYNEYDTAGNDSSSMDSTIIEVLLYPNPCSVVLNVAVTTYIDCDLTIQIFDKFGVNRYTSTINDLVAGTTTFNLNTSEYTSDIYYIHISSETRVVSKVFIVD